MGTQDLGPRALWVYPGPLYCFFRGVRPSVGVKKRFEALTGKFLAFPFLYIWSLWSIVLCEILKYINKSDINLKSYAINPLNPLASHFSTGNVQICKSVIILSYYGIKREVDLFISPVFH